jgi:hypothetical protein
MKYELNSFNDGIQLKGKYCFIDLKYLMAWGSYLIESEIE